MLTYKQYKTLMESTLTTPVFSPQSVGIIGSQLDEAKKKMKKKMDMDGEEVDNEEMEDEEPVEDAETGDGEVVDPASEKDDPEAAADAEAEAIPDEEEDEEEVEGEPSPLMMMKKKMNKMKKKMAADAKDCDDKMKSKLDNLKKKSKGDDKPAPKKEEKAPGKVKKEDAEWWNSLKAMMAPPQQKFSSGEIPANEDVIYPIIDPNTGVATPQPKPGEPGFSPATRLGSL